MTALRTVQFIDVGDRDAPQGSVAWCRAYHYEMCRGKRDAQSMVSTLKYSLISFRENHYFTNLTDRNGLRFSAWEDFVQYPEPYGLGMRADVARAIMEEKDTRRLLGDVIASVQPLKEQPRDEKGRYARSDNVTTGRGNSISYLVARLKRDRPDIVTQLERGEFPSVRTAARAAGIPVETSPLALLRRAWKRAAPEERQTFRAEIAE